MDHQLQDTARRGDTEMLYTSLRENPKMFEAIDNEPFADTPLHIAASSDHYEGNEFAVEIAILKPSFTRKLNADGLTPMHLALQHRKWRTVRTLMTLDADLVRVKGKGGKTPLHVAAEIAPPQLLAELLYVCPSSIEDVTSRWKTAVHIAVEAHRFESFTVLLGWLYGMEKEDLLNSKDIDGNTVLHVATSTNQIQVVKRLLKHMNDDVKNFKGETALAVHERNSGPDRSEEIRRLLQASARKARCIDILLPAHRFTLVSFLRRDLSEFELKIRRVLRMLAKMGWSREKSREVVMVVATLVATATYQGVLSPPGGFWQDDPSRTNSTVNITTAAHSTGKMVMSGDLLSRYITANSSAFAISIALIIACMPGDFLVGSYLALCMVLFLSTYLYAIHSILPPDCTRLRGRVGMMIMSTILLAVVCLYYRSWVARNSVAALKLNTAERGQFLQLVRCDEDANRQRNQHRIRDHTFDTEGLRGP